ncbi:hypothetical protein ACJW31_01G013400 [Castanea mollissima]
MLGAKTEGSLEQLEPAISLYLMLQTRERKLWPIFHPRMKQLCLWALELFSLSKNIDKEVQFLVKDIENETNILLMARTTTIQQQQQQKKTKLNKKQKYIRIY